MENNNSVVTSILGLGVIGSALYPTVATVVIGALPHVAIGVVGLGLVVTGIKTLKESSNM